MKQKEKTNRLNYKSFFYVMEEQLNALGKLSYFGSPYTYSDIVEDTLDHIRYSQILHDELFRTLNPSDVNYIEKFELINMFLQGRTDCYFKLVEGTRITGNELIIKITASIFNVNIHIRTPTQNMLIPSMQQHSPTAYINLQDDNLFVSMPDPLLLLRLRHAITLGNLQETINLLNMVGTLDSNIYEIIIAKSPAWILGITRSPETKLNVIRDIINIESAKIEKLHPSTSYGNFIDTLQTQGYYTEDVAADGNCFFRTMALQLINHDRNEGGTPYTYARLREIAADYIDAHRANYVHLLEGIADDYFPNAEHNPIDYEAGLNLYQAIINHDIDTYLRLIRTDHVFADNLTIDALANALNLNIVIHYVNGNVGAVTPTIDNDNLLEATIVHTAYTGDHYFSLTTNDAYLSSLTSATIDNILLPSSPTHITGAISNLFS